ncbi:MAG: hypothetical protein AABZ08_02040 [Planctomycetota bacterium]
MSDQIIQPARAHHTHWILALLVAIGFAALSVYLQARHLPATFHNDRWVLPDPDDYMRLYRARIIWEGDARIIRHLDTINPPNGVTLHWTAPMDYAIVAPAWIIAAFNSGNNTLETTAAWLPVAMGAVYLILMMRLTGRMAGTGAAITAGLLVLCSRSFHDVFKLGHCDHHCLLELLQLVAIAGLIPSPRSESKEPTRDGMIVSGLCTGLAIWVSPQALLTWGAILAGLTFATRHASPERREIWTRRLTEWGTASLIVVAIGCLIESGGFQESPTLDRIGIVHVLCVGLAVCLPHGRPPGQRSSRAQLVATSTILASIAFVLMFWRESMGGVFRRPEFHRWSAVVTELQPLILRAGSDWTIQPLIRQVGLMPFLLPVTIYVLIRHTRVNCAAKLMFLILSIALTALSVLQLRWMHHINLALVPVTAIGLHIAAMKLMPGDDATRRLSRDLTCLLLAFAMILPCASVALATPPSQPDAFARHWLAAVETISKADASANNNDRLGTILCEMDSGPMLLYYTRRSVVAGPYHRALDGILEVNRFFAERDPVVARSQLDRLHVAYVLVPYRPADQLRIMEQIVFGEAPSYDLPARKIEGGELLESVTPRPEIEQTIAFRLATGVGVEPLGLRLVKEFASGTAQSNDPSGWVYAVGGR